MSKDIKGMSSKFPGHYRGLVVNNTDPLNQGRIKVRIYPVMDAAAVPEIALPWAVPAFPLFDGAGVGTGSFTVPKVGSMVWCFFEAEDFMQPVYFAEARDGVKGITGLATLKQWITDSGFTIQIDEVNQTIRVVHPSGSEINIDNADGTISIQSVGSRIDIQSAGEVNVQATGPITIEGPQVSINP